jgi:hypothetical protein
VVTVLIAVDGYLSVLRIYRQNRWASSQPFASMLAFFAQPAHYPVHTSAQPRFQLQSARTLVANHCSSGAALALSAKYSAAYFSAA